MKLIERLEAHASRGAALLDDKSSTWFDRIDTRKLNQFLSSMCVLGQTYGSFLGGLQKLNLEFGEDVQYGFSAAWPSYYPILTNAWVAEAAMRKAKVWLSSRGYEFVGRGPRAVNVEGDARTYFASIIVRFPPMESEEAGRIATNLINEIHGISRVLRDIPTEPSPAQ